MTVLPQGTAMHMRNFSENAERKLTADVYNKKFESDQRVGNINSLSDIAGLATLFAFNKLQGGGGGSGDLNAAGLTREGGSRDYDQQGYQYEGDDAIGNPRRYLETQGIDPIGPEGQFNNPTWDREGNPVYPPGYDGPKYPRMPRNGVEQQQWQAYVDSGFQESAF